MKRNKYFNCCHSDIEKHRLGKNFNLCWFDLRYPRYQDLHERWWPAFERW